MKLSDKGKDILEWIACLLIAFVLALLIRRFIGTPTVVKQPSMTPTLMPNERLILNKWFGATNTMPSRGDIVTFEAPTSDSYIYPYKFDSNNVIAKYSNEPTSAWGKFLRYILEINKASYIKRVIALPGEHIQIYDGKVYINGEALKEDYLSPEITTLPNNGAYFDLIVPENCLFVMGDNRSESTDSRNFGCIPLDKIESKVWIRFWPLNLFGKVK